MFNGHDLAGWTAFDEVHGQAHGFHPLDELGRAEVPVGGVDVPDRGDDGLIPELQKRGLVRSEYTTTMLRDHLREF